MLLSSQLVSNRTAAQPLSAINTLVPAAARRPASSAGGARSVISMSMSSKAQTLTGAWSS